MARMLRLPAVKERTGLSQSQIYQGVKEGWFPQPAKIMPGEHVKSQAWFDDEIEAYNENRRRDRDERLAKRAADPAQTAR